MYRVYCDNCRNYNYSASRIGKWLCTYCGKELKMKVSTPEPAQNRNKKLA